MPDVTGLARPAPGYTATDDDERTDPMVPNSYRIILTFTRGRPGFTFHVPDPTGPPCASVASHAYTRSY